MAELAETLQSADTEKSALERPLPTERHSPATSLRENVGVATKASLDDASAVAAAGLAVEFVSETAGKPREQKVKSGASQREAAAVAQEYREKAFKLMTAHVKANLQYAHKLTRLTTPFEFFELSAHHVQKQFELIMSQTNALGELSRSLTRSTLNE